MLFALLLGVGLWLLVVIAPLRDALLLAVSLAALSYTALFSPINTRLAGWFPAWPEARRRVAGALLATLLLAGALAAVVLAVLWSILGGLGVTASAIIGVVMRDQDQILMVVDRVLARLAPGT